MTGAHIQENKNEKTMFMNWFQNWVAEMMNWSHNQDHKFNSIIFRNKIHKQIQRYGTMRGADCCFRDFDLEETGFVAQIVITISKSLDSCKRGLGDEVERGRTSDRWPSRVAKPWGWGSRERWVWRRYIERPTDETRWRRFRKPLQSDVFKWLWSKVEKY